MGTIPQVSQLSLCLEALGDVPQNMTCCTSWNKFGLWTAQSEKSLTQRFIWNILPVLSEPSPYFYRPLLKCKATLLPPIQAVKQKCLSRASSYCGSHKDRYLHWLESLDFLNKVFKKKQRVSYFSHKEQTSTERDFKTSTWMPILFSFIVKAASVTAFLKLDSHKEIIFNSWN